MKVAAKDWPCHAGVDSFIVRCGWLIWFSQAGYLVLIAHRRDHFTKTFLLNSKTSCYAKEIIPAGYLR